MLLWAMTYWPPVFKTLESIRWPIAIGCSPSVCIGHQEAMRCFGKGKSNKTLNFLTLLYRYRYIFVLVSNLIFVYICFFLNVYQHSPWLYIKLFCFFFHHKFHLGLLYVSTINTVFVSFTMLGNNRRLISILYCKFVIIPEESIFAKQLREATPVDFKR